MSGSKLVTNSIKKVINLPYRVERSPTDLLKALSRTVQLDPVGPHYTLIDDTVLTPLNFYETQRYQLSKASGYKAARFVIAKYPEAFIKDDCVPHVPQFFPEKSFSEEELKYPSESLIYSLISWGKFTQAHEIYTKCKENSIDVSEPCKLALLDVLCLYNCKDLPEKVPPEELYHSLAFERAATLKSKEMEKEQVKSTWNQTGLANGVFNNLKVKTSPAYCALIKGMGMWNEGEGAFNLYKEMRANGLIPDLNTMNQLIRLVSFSEKGFSDKEVFVINLLKEMKSFQIEPNRQTFNNCLIVVKTCAPSGRQISFTLDILKEMELLKIEPSLATWTYVLEIFYPSKSFGSQTKVLEQILTQVLEDSNKNNGLEWRDEEDCLFFRTAVEKCQYADQYTEIVDDQQKPSKVSTLQLLHSILMDKNNIKFLNDAHLHSKYFENYFMVLFRFETPEYVIKEWRMLTPYIFNRTTKIVEKFLDYISYNKCFDLVPDIWTSFVDQRVIKNVEYASRFINSLLKLMGEYDGSDERLIKNLGEIGKLMIEDYSYKPERVERYRPNREDYVEKDPIKYKWETSMMGDLFKVLIRSNQIQILNFQFDKFVKNQSSADALPGELDEDILIKLAETFCEHKMINEAFAVLEYSFETFLPRTKDICDILDKKLNLDDDKKAYLDTLKQKVKP